MTPLLILLFLFCTSTITPCVDASKSHSWHLQQALSWASRRGADVSMLQLPAEENERNLYVNASVSKGQPLFTLPRQIVINSEAAKRSPLYQAFAPLLFKLPGEATSKAQCMDIVGLIFLENVVPGARKSSEFEMYYNLLPEFDFDHNLPHIDWARDTKSGDSSKGTRRTALDILMAPPVLSKYWQQLIVDWKTQMTWLSKEEGLFYKLSHDTGLSPRYIALVFEWAWKTVATRSFPDIIGTNRDVSCRLIPILDMMDHLADSSIVPFSSGTVYGIRSLINHNATTLPPGVTWPRPLRIDYDRQKSRCAETMLASFGFLPDKTKFCVAFSFEMEPYHKNIKTEYKTLQTSILFGAFPESGDSCDQHESHHLEIRLVEGERFPLQTMAALRVLMADEPILEAARNRTLDFFARPLTLDHERKSLRQLHRILSRVLDKIDGSEETDREELGHWQLVACGWDGSNNHTLKHSRQQCDTNDNQLGQTKYARRMTIALQIRIHRRRILRDAVEEIERTWMEFLHV